MTAMPDPLPLTHAYNLARLGNAGDRVTFAADADQCAAIAAWSDVLSLEAFCVTVDIRKLASDRFALDFTVTADVTQACVVTLEKVPAHLERRFSREFQFTVPVRRKSADHAGAESDGDIVLDGLEDDGPETIENLNIDLAAPALEDYVLALDPYPRCPGAAFETPSDADMPLQSPFAVLKGLKSGL